MKKINTLTFIIFICLVSNVFCHDKVVVIPLIGATACEGDAAAVNVLETLTFSNSGETGITGTEPNVRQQDVTPGTDTINIDQRYHYGTGDVERYSKLVTGNIKDYVGILIVEGDRNVVDTHLGDVVSADNLTGKKSQMNGESDIGNREKYRDSNSDRVRDYLRRPRVVAVITILIVVILGAIMSRKQGR